MRIRTIPIWPSWLPKVKQWGTRIGTMTFAVSFGLASGLVFESSVYSALLLLGFFFLGFVQRVSGYVSFVSFYMASSYQLIGSGVLLTGKSWATVFALWTVYWLVVCTPILLLNGEKRHVRAGFFALLCVLPPLGIFLPANPALAVGALLPGTGVIGVPVFCLLVGCLVYAADYANEKRDRLIAAFAFLAVSIGTNLVFVNGQTSQLESRLHRWVGVGTHVGGGASTHDQALTQALELPAMIKHRNDALVIAVYPEGILKFEDPKFLDVPLSVITHDSVLGIAGSNHLEARDKRVNGLYLFGNTKLFGADASKLVSLHAAVPMPWISWRPWATAMEHTPMNWPNSPVETSQGTSVHFSWCWESLVLWPHLLASTMDLDVFVSLENRWSYANTNIEGVQTGTSRLIARWLGASQVTSINH